MVLGVTDKWARNFADIGLNPPQWYHGSYGGNVFSAIIFTHAINNSMRVVSANMISRPAQTSGGRGGFGGSFGGGFSGGGSGGGGGGSW
jgi:uncharacterized membrane protein YgcG